MKSAAIRIRPLRLARGFTLIETVLMLAMLTALLGGTVLVMSMARTSDQSSRRNLVQRQEIRRFADDFRRDVQAADRLQSGDSELILTSESSGRAITYRIDPGHQINRVVQQPDSAKTANDRYTFGTDVIIKIMSMENSNAARVMITDAGRSGDPIVISASAGVPQS